MDSNNLLLACVPSRLFCTGAYQSTFREKQGLNLEKFIDILLKNTPI